MKTTIRESGLCSLHTTSYNVSSPVHSKEIRNTYKIAYNIVMPFNWPAHSVTPPRYHIGLWGGGGALKSKVLENASTGRRIYLYIFVIGYWIEILQYTTFPQKARIKSALFHVYNCKLWNFKFKIALRVSVLAFSTAADSFSVLAFPVAPSRITSEHIRLFTFLVFFLFLHFLVVGSVR